ncbi:hypothetical protein MBLNU457_4299t1 [Dothideomycetes sp. NU457]
MSADTSHQILGATLPGQPKDSRYDIEIKAGKITDIREAQNNKLEGATLAAGHLLAPSLCHPHVHLDKAFLLSHPRYAHLKIEKGTFPEAMELTSKAKADFEEEDLLQRGNRLIEESLKAGVTHMRAFVEVDPIVNMLCLQAGSKIKKIHQDKCDIQICAFAQLPLFTADDDGQQIRKLMQAAVGKEFSADVVGSTPYVEENRSKMEQNVEWLIDLALEHDKHIDFHLDYNLDPETEPMVWYVLKTLKAKRWTGRTNRKIVLGHCTRLTLFGDEEWHRLAQEIGNLPISFVGLPTSDLYMMRTESGVRGTLPITTLVKKYHLNAAISMNNIGNAFTPYGCCDPLYLANLGVGIYAAGTLQDTELLYECVSTRAKEAIGFSDKHGLQINKGSTADFVLFGETSPKASPPDPWKVITSVSDAVYLYDGAKSRATWYDGKRVD